MKKALMIGSLVLVGFSGQVMAQAAPPGSAANPIPTPMNAQPPVVVQPSPVVVAPPPGVVVPAGVVYVAPAYPAPAIGYVWSYNPRYGWGWFHPRYGWHRGWR